MALILTVAYPIRVSEKGVQGFNFWGLLSRMRWEEIESVSPSQFFGLPWLLVHARSRKSPMWLPLFFADRRAFYDAIAHCAPSDCPILPTREG